MLYKCFVFAGKADFPVSTRRWPNPGRKLEDGGPTLNQRCSTFHIFQNSGRPSTLLYIESILFQCWPTVYNVETALKHFLSGTWLTGYTIKDAIYLKCWPTVYDVGKTFKHNWINISFWLGCRFWMGSAFQQRRHDFLTSLDSISRNQTRRHWSKEGFISPPQSCRYLLLFQFPPHIICITPACGIITLSLQATI